MNKKASLELSINAIVVIIIAITILGLGLGFIRNMFTSTTDSLKDISESIKEQKINELKNLPDRIGWTDTDIKVKISASKEVYFGVKNDQVDPKMFNIAIGCNSAIEPTADALNDIEFKYFTSTPTINPNDVEVMKAYIKPKPSQAKKTSYSCTVKLTESDSGSDYASRNFYVTVE